MTLNLERWITSMLLALFEIFPCVICTLILLLSFCLWYFLLKCCLLYVCFPELYVVLRELDSATIVIVVSEQIHCKCISGPSYLMSATIQETKLLDLQWYVFMKTVVALSGVLHPTPWRIRYLPRLAAFFSPLFFSLPLCYWQVLNCFIRLWGP